ncbi:MAG TPA: SRPBCC family protein, partial [Mycobacterium sp.]
MAKLELSRDLSLGPQDAWAHVSDLSALGDWLQMHEGWRSELPSELAVGTTIVGVA